MDKQPKNEYNKHNDMNNNKQDSNKKKDCFHCGECPCESRDTLCPDEIPASVPDTRFCTPIECPPKIPTKRFSSPNTSLSPEEFEELVEFIEELNEILRAVGNPSNPDNTAPLRAWFKKLLGIMVQVEFECDDVQDDVTGMLVEVGGDFLEVTEINGTRNFIPYSKICTVHRIDCEPPENDNDEPELIDIDPCLRREIVLNFGNVVSGCPELINIFFGIPLYLKMVEFIGEEILVSVEGESEPVVGELVDAFDGKICVEVDDDDFRGISVDEICVIIV